MTKGVSTEPHEPTTESTLYINFIAYGTILVAPKKAQTKSTEQFANVVERFVLLNVVLDHVSHSGDNY